MKKYLFIAIILFSVASNVNWSKNNWKTILAHDIKGYYSYLPAIFIYQDLNFTFFDTIEKKYYSEQNSSDYRNLIDGQYVNKYYLGTAILEFPFFVMGHFISYLANEPLDGYSKYYAILINIASICYLLLGLYFLEQILKRFHISKPNIRLIFFVLVFGTNAFVYSTLDAGLSHIYSFACINGFIYGLYLFQDSKKSVYLSIMSILLGFIILLRPINVIFLLGLPFFFKSFSDFKQTLQEALQSDLVKNVTILLLILSLQLWIYKIQTGHFIIYSYKEEGFNFFKPEILNFLFSYKKGYFLYTPIALIALLGIVPIYQESKYRFTVLLAFLTMLIYVLSSWWNWWYGGSFSSRVMLEYSVFIFIPLGMLLKRITMVVWKRSLTMTLLILTIVCQMQIYQFRYYDIHWENTTKEMYWDNFLRIDKYLK